MFYSTDRSHEVFISRMYVCVVCGMWHRVHVALTIGQYVICGDIWVVLVRLFLISPYIPIDPSGTIKIIAVLLNALLENCFHWTNYM